MTRTERILASIKRKENAIKESTSAIEIEMLTTFIIQDRARLERL